jgi:hypothetical protein
MTLEGGDARYGGPTGDRSAWQADAELPVEGSVEVPMPVEDLWRIFERVPGWPRWNACFFAARVTGRRLAEGATLVWAFNPIRPWYLYKLPAVARLAEVVPERRVTWEVLVLPGFYARHTYWMEPLGERSCRFGSWEVAEGPMYHVLRRFWLAHFRYVRDESVSGARRLATTRR